MQPVKKKLDYTWVIVFACFMLGFFCLGFCSGNKGLYLAAITEALQLPRSLFSLNDSVRYLTTAAMNLVFATVMHKLGIKKMVAAGVLSLVIQCVISATATKVWEFYIAGFFMGMGLALCTTTMISFVIRRWCKENTGKILGFVLAANGVGSAVATQVVSPMIYESGDPFGYRKAYWLMAAILVVVGIIVVPLLLEKTAHVSEDTGKKAAKSRDWVGMDYEEAKKKPYFYLAAICIFLTGMCLQGLSGISAAHMKDTGIDPSYVALVVSIQSLMLAVSKFLAGFSYDKFGMRFTMTFCDVCALLATLLLSLVSATVLGKNLAVAHAVFNALALPLETIMLSLFASELFGNRAFAHTMGIFAAVNTAGYAAGTPLANWCFDAFGTYVPVILFYCGTMLVVTVVFQFILNAAYRERKRILGQGAEK
jgi:MFS family permease